jgi:hypothetical protein
MAAFLHEIYETVCMDSFLFRSAVISFAVVYVLSPHAKGLHEWLKVFGKFALLEVIEIFLSAAATFLITKLDLPLYWMIVAEYARHAVTVIGYALLVCKYPRGIKAVMSGTILATISVCVNLNYAMGRLVGDTVEGLTILLLALIYGLILGMAFFQNKFSIVNVPEFPKFGKILTITANTLALLTVLTTQLLDTALSVLNMYSIIVYTVLLILVFVCYLSVYFLCTERNESCRLKAENQMIRAASEQIALSKSNLEELRKIRHDLKNKYTYMWMLLHEKRYDELNTALESFSPHNLTPSYYVDCGNWDISAIMTAASSKAHDAGMCIQHTLLVPPVLPFDSVELFSLISNLIDNAIESNLRYGITDDITVQMNLRETYLYICVTNRLPDTVSAESVLSFHTKKEKPEDHGLGSQIVRRLAQKYHGHFLADVQDSKFIAEVMLDMLYTKDGENS